MPKPAPSELAEQSTSVENSLRPLQAGPMEHPIRYATRGGGGSDNQPVSEARQSDNQEIRKSASVRAPRGVVRGSTNQPVSELGRSDNQTVSQCQNSVSEASTVERLCDSRGRGEDCCRKQMESLSRHRCSATSCSATSPSRSHDSRRTQHGWRGRRTRGTV